MSNDLVKRLQMWAHECEEQNGPGMWSQDMRLAAEAIERLNADWYSQRANIELLEEKVAALEDR